MSRNLRARIGPALVDWVREFFGRLVAVRLVESSLVLAAQAFLALFPLAIVAYSLLPRNAADGLLSELRHKFGLGGETADAMQTLIGQRDAVQQSLSVFSVLIVIGSATSFTRRLQGMYERAWGLDKLGFRGLWRGVAWALALIVYLGMVGWFAHVIKNGDVVTPLSAVIGFGLWWWTPFLLLGGRVRWRALAPGALITTVAQFVATLVSIVVMPRTIRNNESSYGPIGVVFAIESWLVVVAGILAVGAAIGATIGRIDLPMGTWARGTDDVEGWRREVPRYNLRLKRISPAPDTANGTGPVGPGPPAGRASKPPSS